MLLSSLENYIKIPLSYCISVICFFIIIWFLKNKRTKQNSVVACFCFLSPCKLNDLIKELSLFIYVNSKNFMKCFRTNFVYIYLSSLYMFLQIFSVNIFIFIELTELGQHVPMLFSTLTFCQMCAFYCLQCHTFNYYIQSLSCL